MRFFRWFGLFGFLVSASAQAETPAPKPPTEAELQMWKGLCEEGDDALYCAKYGGWLEKQGKKAEALPFYKKACDASIKPQAMACYFLAAEANDPALALPLYQKACDLKDSDSCTAAGDIVSKGGSEKAREASVLYRKGCAYGDGRGCHRLGRFYVQTKQEAKVSKVLLRSCQLGYAPGCGYAGWFLETKLQKPANAEALYRKGCAMKGGAVECARLGLSLLKQKKDPKEALRFLRRSCRQGFKTGCDRARLLGKSFKEP